MPKSNGTYAIYVNSTRQKVGDRNTMLREGKALGRPKNSGAVTVWELDADGSRIGRRPIFRSYNGKVTIKP